MSQILNTTPETLGVGAIVKFNSSCPVITTLIKGDARLGMGSVSGKATFTVVTPGDYEFKATCDCGGSYTVMYAGEGAGECCVNPLTNPTGELLGIEIDGVEYFSPAVTADTFMAVIDNADGSQSLQRVDADGNPVGPVKPINDVDTFATLSDATITLADGSTINVPTGSTYDATTNSITTSDGVTTVLATDTNTFAVYDATAGTLTTAGGDVVPLAGDTYMTVVTAADGSQSLQRVDQDGNPVGSAVSIGTPTDELVDCNGDVVTGSVVTCGPNDYIHAPMLEMGQGVRISPLNNDNLCDSPAVTLVSGSGTNVSVVINVDGSHTVTPVGDACAEGAWSYDYETTCNGETQTATVSGYVDNAVQTHAFSTANDTTVDLALVLASGGDYDIDWGDGVVDTVASGTAVNTHVYTAPYTGDVIVSFPACSEIRQFISTAGRWSFDIGTLPSGMTTYNNAGQNTTNGDIGTLPSGMTTYYNTGQNTTNGDIGTLPSGMTFYYNAGQNTTNGDIGTLPSGMTTYNNAGQNTTNGDIGTLPSGMTYYYNTGQNTTNGDIGTLPSGVMTYNNAGQNTVTALTTNWSASATMRYFLQHGVPNNSTEVDNMLVALASNVTSWTVERTVNVAGSNASPSATGTSAIPAISAAGATTILTN